MTTLFCHQRLISKKTIIFQGSGGGPAFSRGSNFFQGWGVQLFPGGGGSNCLLPIETHVTFDFPRGVQTPYPPWIRTCCGPISELDNHSCTFPCILQLRADPTLCKSKFSLFSKCKKFIMVQVQYVFQAN